MSLERELKNIPDSEVDKIVADFKSEKCDPVTKEKQPDGKWTVRATCPERSNKTG
jgi:hypothetical protein